MCLLRRRQEGLRRIALNVRLRTDGTQPIAYKGSMDYDFASKRLPYQGWEVRSRLTHVSMEGTVAAGAELYVGEVLKCHLVSCKQFALGSDAISAIERKATLWIDDSRTHSRSNDVAAALLS